MARFGVLVVGAGGFGREIVQYLRDADRRDRYAILGFLDDHPDPERLRHLGLPYLGPIDAYAPLADQRLVLAVGDPTARLRIARTLTERGARFLTLIHPAAYVAGSAEIGEGCVLAPFASVGAGAVLGPQAQVHFYASAAHDTRIGAGSALSPYAVVNGGAVLDEGVFLGARATVNPLKHVGAYAKVAAGAVVYHDVPAGALASGNPARSRVLHLADDTATTGRADDLGSPGSHRP